MIKGVHVDNAAWAVLVAIGSLGSGIVSSLGTTASMRRGTRDERRKEIDDRIDAKDRVDAKITVHASSCKLSDHLAEVIERNQEEVADDLEQERRERSIGREANHASIERMRVEIVDGQKEILEHVVKIQTVQAEQGARLDAHDKEITRLRDGKNGGRRE